MTRQFFGFAVAAVILLTTGTNGQEGGRGESRPVPTTVVGQVRVIKSANVHAAPTSTAIVLVNVPQGTVLNVLERRGVWLTIQLTPALRQQGTPVRWYRSETHGFMHTSTVEAVQGK